MTRTTHFHIFTRATKNDPWQHETSFDNRRDAADEARDYREGYQQLKTKIVASTAQSYWEVVKMIKSVNGVTAGHPIVVDDDGNEIKPASLCRRIMQHKPPLKTPVKRRRVPLELQPAKRWRLTMNTIALADLIVAHQQGAADYARGRPQIDNPYPITNAALHDAYKSGWCNAMMRIPAATRRTPKADGSFTITNEAGEELEKIKLVSNGRDQKDMAVEVVRVGITDRFEFEPLD